MPKRSGFDVLEWLRKTKKFEHIPVIVLSSSDETRDLKRIEELGAAKYFMKSSNCYEVTAFLKTLD